MVPIQDRGQVPLPATVLAAFGDAELEELYRRLLWQQEMVEELRALDLRAEEPALPLALEVD